MLDLDKYINNFISVKLFGETYRILEPTMEMVMTVDKMEVSTTEDNVQEKRLEVLELLMNHNVEKKLFVQSDLVKLPFEAVSRLTAEICAMRYEADLDPNLKSRSPKGK